MNLPKLTILLLLLAGCASNSQPVQRSLGADHVDFLLEIRGREIYRFVDGSTLCYVGIQVGSSAAPSLFCVPKRTEP